MRGVVLGLLVLLAACSGQGLGGGQPGIDVADAALRGGSPQIALQVVDGVLAKDPGNERALITRGEALTALGRLEEAGMSFSAALQRDPASVEAHIGLGRVKLASDPAGAEALFLEALQRDPRNGTALNDLGIARDLQGRHADAQAAYRQALAIDASMSAAQVNLALSMAMSGQSGEAVQLLRPLASNPDASPKLRHDLAAVLTMAGQKAEAARILSADLTPDDVERALKAYAAAKSAGSATTLVPDTAPLAESVVTPQAAPSAAAPSVTAEALRAPPPRPTSPPPNPAPLPVPTVAEAAATPPAAAPSVTAEALRAPPPRPTGPPPNPAPLPVPTVAEAAAAPQAAPPAALPPVEAEALAVPPPSVTNPPPAPAATPPTPAAAPDASANPAPTVAAETPPNPTTAPTAARSVAANPVPEPAASPDAAPPASTASLSAHNGSAVRVQLASVDSESGAKSEWQRLRKRMPDILDGRQPIIVKGERDGRAVWRLRAGGFDNVGKANEFCDQVHAAGGVCITIQ